MHACMYFSAQMEKWAEIVYKEGQKGNLIASRRLEWWLPQYEVDQGYLVASRRLEWWLPEWHALTFRNDFYDNSFLIMTPHTIKIK